MRNILCSSFRGRAKPLMMLQDRRLVRPLVQGAVCISPRLPCHLPAQDLQELSNPVVMLRLIDEPEERAPLRGAPCRAAGPPSPGPAISPHYSTGKLFSRVEHLCSPVEDVVDLSTDVSPETQKLAVDAMQDGLEEVPLSRILTVKQV